MKYRKSTFTYIAYSCIIHIILLFCVWLLYPYRETPLHEPGSIIGDLYSIPRPNIVKPPEPFVEPIKPETESTVEEKVEKPHIPKPMIDLNLTWNVNVNNNEPDTAKDIRSTKTGKQKPDGITKDTYSDRSLVEVSDREEIHSTTQSVNREVFTLSRSTATFIDDVQADSNKVQFDKNNTLSGLSPSVNAPDIQFGSRRGDALRTTSMSNTWSKSGSSGGGKHIGIYPKMMKAIAEELRVATTSEKVDIVLLLDETASMVDNISGIRAYFDLIFDTFRRDNRDVRYGLVTFTDKTKTYSLTDNVGKFKNWLYKIDVNHGGDISESGLDAIMSAMKQIKFRQDSQRFFILASDAAFHDADYDGKSRFSLDEVIATLQKEGIRVEVIGLDYLPIKQIALATGGTWRAIPGKGYLEYVPRITLTMKMLSKLGTLSIDGSDVGDKIIVYVNNPPRPKQLKLTWKVLNPLGERCYGPFTETTEIPDNDSKSIELTPELNKSKFLSISGVYTVIYKLENDRGHKSILRKTITYQE